LLCGGIPSALPKFPMRPVRTPVRSVLWEPTNLRSCCPPAVGVLDRQTYQGGTRGSWLRGGGSWSGERELEGMHKDTGHKIYTGSGCQGGEPYLLFGASMAPCAWCWVGQMSS
jgi:hypothetical protein